MIFVCLSQFFFIDTKCFLHNVYSKNKTVPPFLCIFSSPGRETTESTVSQQLSVGDDSLGSWSNLSFEDEHPDDNSSFLHLSDRYTQPPSKT